MPEYPLNERVARYIDPGAFLEPVDFVDRATKGRDQMVALLIADRLIDADLIHNPAPTWPPVEGKYWMPGETYCMSVRKPTAEVLVSRGETLSDDGTAYTCLNCHQGGHVEAECPVPTAPYLDFVFTAMPGPANECVFVEVERDGRSVRVGTWIEHPDGYASLRITPADFE